MQCPKCGGETEKRVWVQRKVDRQGKEIEPGSIGFTADKGWMNVWYSHYRCLSCLSVFFSFDNKLELLPCGSQQAHWDGLQVG